jgi:hypothetical protein
MGGGETPPVRSCSAIGCTGVRHAPLFAPPFTAVRLLKTKPIPLISMDLKFFVNNLSEVPIFISGFRMVFPEWLQTEGP